MTAHEVAEVAHQIEIIPLIWLAVLTFRGQRFGGEWWWLAGAFFVSWLADTASHWVGQPFVSMIYPVVQAGLIGGVLLYKSDAIKLVVLLILVGVADILWHGIIGTDILLRTVAWLAVVGIVYPFWQLGRLRTTLLVTFGIGWVTWMSFVIWPSTLSWAAYHLTWLAGILLFCWAASNPLPHFRLIRA